MAKRKHCLDVMMLGLVSVAVFSFHENMVMGVSMMINLVYLALHEYTTHDRYRRNRKLLYIRANTEREIIRSRTKKP